MQSKLQWGVGMLAALGVVGLTSKSSTVTSPIEYSPTGADLFCIRQGLPFIGKPVNLTEGAELYNRTTFAENSTKPVLVSNGPADNQGRPGYVSYAAPLDTSIRMPMTCASWYVDYMCATNGINDSRGCMEYFYSIENPCGEYLSTFFANLTSFTAFSSVGGSVSIITLQCITNSELGILVPSEVEEITCEDQSVSRSEMRGMSAGGSSQTTVDITIVSSMLGGTSSAVARVLSC